MSTHGDARAGESEQRSVDEVIERLVGKFPGVDPISHTRINGKPLRVSELVEKVNQVL